MFSIFLLMLAAAGASIACYCLPAWRRSGSQLMLFCLVALGAVVIETLLAGLGRWLEAGQQLRNLYAIPALLMAFSVPLTLFTLATLSRRLGFGWARIDWGHGTVCLLAVALVIYNLKNLLSVGTLAPACWQDVTWYLPDVPQGLACPGEPPPQGAGPWPADLLVVVVAWLAFGAGVWKGKGRPWLCVVMTLAGVLLLLPAAWGPLPWYLGLILAFSAIALECTRHAAVLARPPDALSDASSDDQAG